MWMLAAGKMTGAHPQLGGSLTAHPKSSYTLLVDLLILSFCYS
jgi:hypothetical protein